MVTDIQEEDIMQEYRDGLEEKEEGINDISKGIKMSKKEIDHEYENLDLSKFNDVKNG